jgi:hypothetical protein
MYVARSDSLLIELVGVAGQITQRMNVATTRVPTSVALRDQYFRQLSGPAPDTSWNAITRSAPMPRFRQVVGRIWVADDGSIAIERADLDQRPGVDGDSLTLDVIEPSGRVRGRLVLAPDLRPLLFTGSAIYCVQSDSSHVIGFTGETRTPILLQRLHRFRITGGQ